MLRSVVFFEAIFFMKSVLVVVTVFLASLGALAQSGVIINGTVKDKENGETLIGASVEVTDYQSGVTSNEYGFYSLTVPLSKDTITIRFSYIGYKTVVKRVVADRNLEIIVQMEPIGQILKEVVIAANGLVEKNKSTEMSVATLNVKEAKLLPALFGEVDIIKIIQLKPGVNGGSEGSTGLFVRGGGPDQNLIVLDEAIVYNASHLFGFFSTFNSDALKDVKIFKGGFPSQYGGRLSSVIDVRLKEGNNQKFSGAGGLGLIASRLTLEGPIQKGKSSFIVSGRRTYVDIFTNAVNKANEGTEGATQIPGYYFYDLNTKVNFELGPKDRLFISGYFGRDVFAFSNKTFNFNFNWGNATGTARWNHVFNPKLFLNTTFTYSDYQYNISNKLTGFAFNTNSNIRDANLKMDFYNNINQNHSLRFGGNVTYHQFAVGRLKAGSDDGKISFSAGQDFDGTEIGAYISDEYQASKDLKINAGFRLSSFLNNGKASGLGWEPRVAANYALTDKIALKASYSRMYQYVHLISNSGISLPTDIWYPTTDKVKPQTSDQFATGISWLLGKDWLITNEYYYKLLGNQIEFKDGAQLFANDNIEDEFSFGKGYAYGMEWEIEKKAGKLTGWIGYTLAWVKKGGFPDIMDGRYFSPRYDRRHNLTVVAIYELNRRISLTSSFVFGSGDVGWLPSGRSVFQNTSSAPFDPVIPIYGDRNTFRMPNYHRLDLGMVIRFWHKWGESDLTFSVYNAYDRRNAYILFLEPEFKTIEQGGVKIEVPTRIAAKQISLFPILPAITWNFKF